MKMRAPQAPDTTLFFCHVSPRDTAMLAIAVHQHLQPPCLEQSTRFIELDLGHFFSGQTDPFNGPQVLAKILVHLINPSTTQLDRKQIGSNPDQPYMTFELANTRSNGSEHILGLLIRNWVKLYSMIHVFSPM
jgi:hypothetical protein